MSITYYDYLLAQRRIKARYKYAFWSFVIGVLSGMAFWLLL